MDRKMLKSKAKESLKGKYGDAILMGVIYTLIMGVVGGLEKSFFSAESGKVVFSLNAINLIVTSLFIMGMYSYYLKVSRNEKVTWEELFSKTNLFGPALLITFLVCLFVGLWSILFIIPGFIAALAYSQVYYIKLDNPELEVMDVLRKSKELMNGHKMDYFVLLLSFTGWMLLGLLTFGVLYLWLIPYMSVTEANFYNELIKKKK